MKSFSSFLLFAFIILLAGSFFSCRKKMICPAYNSAFILGEEDQTQFLSQFTEDSIPEIKESLRTFMEKNQFGIVVKVKEKKKWKLIDFVPMDMVLPLVDSTLMDSTGQIATAPYNREQLVYMRKFGEQLTFIDPSKSDTTQTEDLGGKKKRKKKKKDDEEDEFDEIDEDDPDYDPWSSGGDDVDW